jgi:hypothetical protein
MTRNTTDALETDEPQEETRLLLAQSQRLSPIRVWDASKDAQLRFGSLSCASEARPFSCPQKRIGEFYVIRKSCFRLRMCLNK